MTNFSKIFHAVSGMTPVEPEKGTQIVAGLESSNAAMQAEAISGKTSMASNIGAVLTSLADADPISNEAGITLGSQAIIAAQEAAVYALNPATAIQTFGNRGGKVEGDDSLDRSMVPMSTISFEQVTAGLESFTKVDAAASMYFSIAIQSLVLKQDPVIELLYPIFVLENGKHQYSIEVASTSILIPSKKNLSGKAIGTRTIPLLKNLDEVALDANRLYPVVRAENANILLNPAGKGLATTVKVGDNTSITTAPVKTGVDANLLTLSQTDELLAQGFVDETDMLEPSLPVVGLTFSLTGNNSGGTSVTDYFNKDVSGFNIGFLAGRDGKSTGLELNFKTSSIIFKGGEFQVANSTTNSTIAKLASLGNGHYAKVTVQLVGNADMDTGDFKVTPVTLELEGIYDTQGNGIDPTSTEYTDVASVFSTITLPGVTPKPFARNDNMRFSARQLVTEVNTYVYSVQRRAIHTEITPVGGESGNNVQSGIVDDAINTMTKHGLEALFATANSLKNSPVDSDIIGIGSFGYNKTYIEDSFNLSTIVDGERTAERTGDITEALKLRIANVARKLYTDSNYFRVFNSQKTGAKPTVLVGTDFDLGTFLQSWTDGQFNYIVASSTEKQLKGKVFITFGLAGKERNAGPSLIGFGICAWSPEVTLAGPDTTNGRVAHKLIHMPAYDHRTFLPILGEMTVTGVEATLGKLALNTHSV